MWIFGRLVAFVTGLVAVSKTRVSRRGFFQAIGTLSLAPFAPELPSAPVPVPTPVAQEFSRIAFPLVRRIWQPLVANQLVGVQPMQMPSAKLFYMENKYGEK